MPDNFQGDFLIQISGAANPILGQNGQGVCGVTLNFNHEYIGDLRITLTSPSGQSVTLIGPIGLFGETDGTSWNIAFVPCADSPAPDPGFSDIWSNNQPWGMNGAFSGSYHPQGGCLENFTGPVNGQWTLTVLDGQGNDVGNFVDYSIIFCDPDGILCFSCEASAGNLPQPDIMECQGSPNLSLNLPPTYTPPFVAAPTDLYSYTYVIGSGGVIIAYEDNPDLSAYPSGTYTICGMSYLTQQQGLIPPPDGSLTIQQLATQLNSSTPPFCGKITVNCVNVTILEVPPNVDDYETICAPECFEYYGQNFCTTGDHVRNLTQNGCPYTATLHLTVLQRSFATVFETICSGSCAQTPGFENACTPGQHIQTFTGSNGCDSVVTLNLNVVSAIAVIVPPAPITCVQPTTALLGTGSTPPGSGGTYLWTAGNGGTLLGPVNQINATAGSAGTYTLRVCRTVGTNTCCDTATVTILADQTPPMPPDTIFGPVLLCPNQTAGWSTPTIAGISTYTWTVPPGATINSGQGTPTINVTWDTTSAGTICVQSENTCGISAPTCLDIQLTPPLSLPTIPQGNVLACVGDTVLYTTGSASGAVGFLWEMPANAVLLAGQNTDSVQVVWTAPGSASVCLRAIGACDTTAAVCLAVQINQVPGMPVVSGPDSLCAGSTAEYHIMPVPGADGYLWNITGGLISGNSDTTDIVVVWSSLSPTGTVCAQAYNACGLGPTQCLDVFLQSFPVANAGADAAVCSDQIHLAAALSVPGNTGLWQLVSGPGSIVFDDNTLATTLATASLPGTYYMQWTEQSGLLCATSDTVQVQFWETPTAGVLSATCDAANEFYSVEIQIMGGTPPYQVNGISVAGTPFVSQPILSGSTYSFTVTDTNGCTVPALMGFYDCNCATFAGFMTTQPLEVCVGQTVQVQASTGAVLDANDVTQFVLHTGSGNTLGQVLAQNSTGVFSLLPGMVPDSIYYVSAVVANDLNGMPDLTDPCLSVAVGQPVIFHSYPLVLAGSDATTCDTTLSLNGSPLTGVWSVLSAPPGGSVTIANNQNGATAVTTQLPGAYTLVWTTASFGCAASDTVQVEFFETPQITGVQTMCDAANENYTVLFDISGGALPYSVNGSPVAGNTFVSAPIQSGDLYNFTATDANGCISPSIAGTFSCACATSAGSMAAQPLSRCVGDSVVATSNGNYVLDGNDTTAFVLHTGAGPVLGQVFDQNHTGIFGMAPGMDVGVTYYISVVVGNAINGFPDSGDPCFSVAPGQPVVFLAQPNPEAGISSAVCAQSALLTATASSGTSGTWSLLSGPGTALFTDPALPVSGVTASSFGQYLFQWSETNGVCAASDTVSIFFHENPAIQNIAETCIGTNTGYFLEFTVTGGTPPYSISGLNGVFAGADFLSETIPNNGTYTFLITDSNSCVSPQISGAHGCQCATNAGTMSTTPTLYCAGQPAQGIWNNNATLDADDMVQYVLHTQSGNLLGSILGTGNQPVFAFGPALQPGVTYYISAIAGNNAGGMVDLNDPCLSVAAGSPVQWKPLPTATLSGDNTVCAGQQATLLFGATGTFPITISYSDGAGGIFQILVPGQQSVPLTVTPAATTTYTLTQAADGTLPMCSTAPNGSATVTVRNRLRTGTAAAPVTLCAGMSQTITLSTLLQGADPGGIWSEVSSSPSSSGAFAAGQGTFQTAGQVPGTYVFRYSIAGQSPCPNDSTAVQVIIFPNPVSDAGLDQVLDCNHPSATLGGVATSTGSGTTYAWTLNGGSVPAGNLPTLPTNILGEYVLSVANIQGCTAHDTVRVSEAAPALSVGPIQVLPILCFGQRNGSIRVDSVQGGTAPVLFSLNGGTFGNATQFNNLAAGNYTLTAQDAAGCEWSATFEILEPPAIKIDLGGDIEAALGDSVYLSLQTVTGPNVFDNIVWQPLLDSAAVGMPFQHFFPLQSVRIAVEVSDSNGCRAYDEIYVRVRKERQVYVPNVFAPESLQNDLFSVSVGRDVEQIEVLEVFSRWGDRVYEARNFLPAGGLNGWDGTFRGKAVEAGVYAYYLQVLFRDGEKVLYTGSITILR